MIVVIFSVKDWIIITVAFMDHTVSVITIQLYCNNTKAAIDKHKRMSVTCFNKTVLVKIATELNLTCRL